MTPSRLVRRCTLVFLVLGIMPMACTSSTPASSCTSAGGTCIIGPGIGCVKQASTNAQDCNSSPPNPGGGICCLEFQDGGATSDASSDGPSAEGSGELPSCTWPASLDPTDAADGQCTAARALLECGGGDAGVEEICISNDPTQCSSDGVTVPGVRFTCHDECSPTEYGAVCGGIGPSAPPAASPPSGCRSMGVTPGGTQFYCCPCGDGGDEAGVAEADAVQPIPEAFVDAVVGPGTGGPSTCGFASDETFLQIGSPTKPFPTTATSGTDTVTLSCQVDPNSGGFNIHLRAEIAGVNGGSISVDGLVTASGGSGIQGAITSATAGTFTDSNCTITFTYDGLPVSVASPIAAGRIWGHIDCPNASLSTDGGTVNACDAYADFLFENCE